MKYELIKEKLTKEHLYLIPENEWDCFILGNIIGAGKISTTHEVDRGTTDKFPKLKKVEIKMSDLIRILTND